MIEGCPYCNLEDGAYLPWSGGDIYRDGEHFYLEGREDVRFYIGYCPNCGRKLDNRKPFVKFAANEKIKIYFTYNGDTQEAYLPASFTFKDVSEHFGCSLSGKNIHAKGVFVTSGENISNLEYLDYCGDRPFVDIVVSRKRYG